jgi:hypothetical protein
MKHFAQLICFLCGVSVMWLAPQVDYSFRLWYSRYLLDCTIRIAPDVTGAKIDQGVAHKPHKNGVCYG